MKQAHHYGGDDESVLPTSSLQICLVNFSLLFFTDTFIFITLPVRCGKLYVCAERLLGYVGN